MALIEHLEREDWQDVLRRSFEYTLDVLKNDRFRPVGSAVDDLRGWLAAGGIPRVRERLNQQMAIRRFPPTRQAQINQFLERLAQEHRGPLLELMAGGILPSTRQDWLAACGLDESQFEELLSRILSGERPFEDWMHAHEHSDQEIEEIHRRIDQWLIRHGIIPPPAGSSLH
ncbi:MAG: hypothetical protein FJ290_33430 [Planctomycetes bacterium]|nr:hypothetical protein [Planctomycetota bacterium]